MYSSQIPSSAIATSTLFEEGLEASPGVGRKIAQVLMARRPAVRPYWRWHQRWDYEQWKKFGPLGPARTKHRYAVVVERSGLVLRADWGPLENVTLGCDFRA